MNAIAHAYVNYSTKRFPVPSRTKLLELEERIEISLPEDFRQFLLDFNGGFFNEPNISPSSKGCPEDCLTFLNGIGASSPVAELASETDLALFEDNSPPQILPIGYTMMGNMIILITHYENNGFIMLKTFKEYFFLANGIEEFFSLLSK